MIFASYVTALCRKQLWEEVVRIEKAGDRIVMLATDGIIAAGDGGHREVALQESSSALGKWETADVDEGVFFESGVYCLRKGDVWSMKVRGLPGVAPEKLMACPTPSLEVTFQSPLHLKPALIQRRPENLGVFEERKRELNPAKAAEDGGFSFHRSFVSAPLSSYFTRSWKLLPRGTPHDDAEDGIVLGGKRMKQQDREADRSDRARGRPRRNPLKPMSLGTMLKLGVEG
jgi:hypothetical protein